MRYVRYLRYFSAAVFIAALSASWSVLVGADDPCIAIPPYYGFGYQGPVSCSEGGEDYCDAFCDLCYQTECQYVNNCVEQEGVSGACMAPY